jgi:N-acetylneuraminate synthase
MTSPREIAEAVQAARSQGAAVALLHCVSAYPARHADANLRMIPRLAEDFGCIAGLSDHTLGTSAAVAAVALGACVIEKHVTLARADGGPDAAFSLEPEELKRLVQDCRAAWEALGRADYLRSEDEAINRQFRRSLYVVRPVAKGARITSDDVRSIRPGFGLEPKHLDAVLGRAASRDLARGEPLALDMLD